MKSKLLLLFTFFSLTLFSQITQQEREALIALYNATDGDNWTDNSGWDNDPDSNSNVTYWNGISLRFIDGTYRVSSIVLENNNLTGTLPDLSDLPYLQLLYLGNNNLSGGFPDFSSMAGPAQIDLSDNNYAGAIEEAHLPSGNISRLDIGGNSFSGTLPVFENIGYLDISHNDYDQIDTASLINVSGWLFLNGNPLTGGVPDLSSLTKVTVLNMSDIDFSGHTFTNGILPPNLTQLYLQNNNLTGTIDSSYFSSSLTFLSLEGNTFSGQLDCSGFADLTSINISGNHFNYLNVPFGVNPISYPSTFNISNTPKLAYVHVAAGLTNFYNLPNSYFDIGVRILNNSVEVDTTVVANEAEREAIKEFYRGRTTTYGYTVSGGSNEGYINVSSIDGEARITTIYLNGVNLFESDLSADIAAFTELRQLVLVNAGLTSLPDEIGMLTKLEVMGLQENSLTSLPNTIGNLTLLEILNLNNNSLSILPDEIANAASLINFYINYNSLTALPENIGNLTNLERFYFNYNDIEVLPPSMGGLASLQDLQFEENEVTLIPPQLGDATNMVSLTANNNPIASIPTEFGQLVNLTYVDLANCEISNTPAAFANLTALETLYLNNNQLQVVEGLGGFTRLKYLRIHNNRLGEDNSMFDTDLPDDMGDLVLLEELTLHDNLLTGLPATIGNLVLLTELDVSDNRLASLPDSIGSLSALVTLDVRSNELTALPTTIGDLSSLQTLYLSDYNAINKLATLPDEIGNLSNLRSLYISDMSTYENGEYVYYLKGLPSTMNQLTSLRVLDASNNGIEGLVDLTNVTGLTELRLNNNKIADLKIDAPVANFISSNASYYFNIMDNPFITCVEVPEVNVNGWLSYYATTPSIADNGITFSDDCSGFRVPQSERDALIALYLATGGGDEIDSENAITWVGEFWDTDPESLSNVGSWQGVTTEIIDGQKHVTELVLSYSNDLSGAVPAEIGDLSELTKLDLGYGSVVSIPEEIGSLEKLSYLDLSSNSLTSIPAGIGNLTNLVELRLNNQRTEQTSSSTYTSTLTSLPDEIGDLSSLTYLNLSYNGLTSLPSGIGNLTSIEKLYLNNQDTRPNGTRTYTLTSLPHEIGSLTTLEELYLSNVGLLDLPMTINGLTGLTYLDLRGNELTSLPSTIGGMSSLETLYLSGSGSESANKLSTLPVEFGELSNLKNLYMDYMRRYEDGGYVYYLTSLPSTMSQLSSLEIFTASNNAIEGTVDLSNVTTLTRLNISNNKISDLKLGTPATNFISYTNVSYFFNIKNNPFISCVEVSTDHLEAWLTRYENYPSIADNGITFSDDCTGFRVPKSERDALIAFYLATNGGDAISNETGVTWVGEFWDTDSASLSNVGAWQGVTTEIIDGQKHVTELVLSYSSDLSGEIPSSIADLTQLKTLDLGYGEIESVSEEIGDLANLTYLDLSSNSLTSIPAGIGNLTNLVELRLNTQRTGQTSSTTYTSTLTSLPDEIGDLSSLTYLNVSYNGLTSLPAGIGNLTSIQKLYMNNQDTRPNGTITYTLTSLPDEIGSLETLEELYVQQTGLTALPVTINNLVVLKVLQAYENTISGYVDLSNLDLIEDLELDYNNIYSLKLTVSPTSFGTNVTSPTVNDFGFKRNACGCIEVPSDELVAWQLSVYNEENNFIDNGVVYSDDCASVSDNSIPDNERAALIAIYNNTQGATWKNDLSKVYDGVPWSVNDDRSNVGAWYGVTTEIINGQKHVTAIDLYNNYLDGEIPDELRSLTALKLFDIGYNAITDVSEEIGSLGNLAYLNLSSFRSLDNTAYVLEKLPEGINNLTNLQYLDVGGNPVGGNYDFSNLTNLTYLSVSSNNNTGLKLGVAPTAFDQIYYQDYGYYGGLTIDGTYLNCIGVPESTITDWEQSSSAARYPDIVWGKDCTSYNNVPVEELEALMDMYTSLDGENWTNNSNWVGAIEEGKEASDYNVTTWSGITTGIVNGQKHITRIDLYARGLAGEFEESIGNFTALNRFNVGSNDIAGSLPTSFGDLTSLTYLDLSRNDFTGALPAGMVNFNDLELAYFNYNAFTEAIPDLTGLANLTYFYIQNNSFHFGDFEDEFISYVGLTSFPYSNQAEIGEEKIIEIDETGVTLEANVRGVHNAYQWYKNNSMIDGATSSSYVIENATAEDNGFYFCRITNSVVNNLTLQTARQTLIHKASQLALYSSASNGEITVNIDSNDDGLYNYGTVLELTAVPNEGYVFDSWSGDVSSTDNPLTITMDSDKNITALFIMDATGGTNDVSLEDRFKVYPNPVESTFFIEVDNIEVSRFELYTVLGKKIKSLKANEGNTLDITSLSKGVYILNVITEKGVLTKRIIKK